MKIFDSKLRLNTISNNFIPFYKDNQILIENISYPLPRMFIYTANFANFEQFLWNQNEVNHQYHLSGYGTTNYEALLGFLGESAERYSYAVSSLSLKDNSFIDSYENLKDKKLPFQIIKQYNSDFEEDTFIDWCVCNTLNGENILVPLELIVFDNFKVDKKFQGVSTGCAAHESFFDATINGILEYLQLDSFNLWWYSGFLGKEVDITNNLNNIGIGSDFLYYFNIKVSNIKFDKPVDVYVCEIFGKFSNVPQYTVGVQAGLDSEKAINRAILEALTILEYNFNLPWFNTELYKSVNSETCFDDLDKNVIYYSKNGKPDLFKQEFINWNKASISTKEELLKYISNEYKNATVLDISVPDLKYLNQHIARVYIPELIPMMVPNNVYYQHTRFLKFGGVRNDFPSPLP